MKSSARKVELASVADLLSTEQERQDAALGRLQHIPLSELYPFPDHPFSVKDDDSMKETVESICAQLCNQSARRRDSDFRNQKDHCVSFTQETLFSFLSLISSDYSFGDLYVLLTLSNYGKILNISENILIYIVEGAIMYVF